MTAQAATLDQIGSKIDEMFATASSVIDDVRAQRDSYKAMLGEALERAEELEEIIRDLVQNHDELNTMGAYPGRAAVFRKAWDRAAEAVGLDDGADA